MSKERTPLEKLEFDLKQANEASSLFNEIEDRLCWAHDFAEGVEIRENINELWTPISEVIDNMDDLIQMLEDEIDRCKYTMKEQKASLAEEFGR